MSSRSTPIVHDYVKTTTGLAEPRTGLEGKFSIYHVLAVALADGAAFLDQFTDERVADPELAALRRRVTRPCRPRADQGFRARRAVAARRPERSSATSPHNLGTPDNPMTDGQLEDKFNALASPVLGRARTDELAAASWKFLELDDIRNCST